MKNAMIKTVVRNNIIENEEKIVHIYSDIDDAVNSFKKDSDNPMKKVFIESAIDNNCTAYNNYWSESSVFVSKEAVIALLKTMNEEDINFIFDSVISSLNKPTKEEYLPTPTNKIKNNISKNFDKIDIFNKTFKIDPSRLIKCINRKVPKREEKSEDFFTKFDLYKEDNGEKLRLIVYKVSDVNKEKPYPTNLLFDKDGKIYFNETEVSLLNKSLFTKTSDKNEFRILTHKINIPIKLIFGRGFNNNKSICFYYKNGDCTNNSYTNIVSGKKK